MRLYIDTSRQETITVGIGDKKIEHDAKIQKTQMLLEVIEKELQSQGKTVKDLTEIEINLGPGSFTGLRVGVAVANTLAWALNIPINGKKGLVEPQYE